MKTREQKHSPKSDVNLMNLIERFASEDQCRTHLTELRWPKGLTCPRCNCQTLTLLNEGAKFDCAECTYQFTVTSATIFHDTHLPLRKWFIAI